MRGFVLIALLVAACSVMPESGSTSNSQPTDPSHSGALNDSEIERVLNGHYIEFDQGENYVGSYRIRRETYCNGLMTTAGERVSRITASYTIENGRICVGSGSSISCRRLHRDGEGALQMQWLRQDGSLIATHRIELGALPMSECGT